MTVKLHVLSTFSVVPSIINIAEPHAMYIKHITWLDWLCFGIDIERVSKR